MEDKEILEISAKIERDFEKSLSEHKPFCEEINKMMADNDWNIKIVERKTELSSKVCREMLQPNRNPNIKTVISFCIGFRLSLTRTEHLLKSAGLAFDLSNKVHHIYYHLIILNTYKKIDIIYCNKIIKARGITKIDDFLGSHSREEKIETI